MASDSWFSDEPTWKRVLISIASQKFLVYPESLESCMHQIDVSDVVAVAVTDTTKRAFELAFRAPAGGRRRTGAIFSAAPSVQQATCSRNGGGLQRPSSSAVIVERFRFRCDHEEELRQWIAVTERWCDHWRSKSARASVVENLLAQLDASDAAMRQLPLSSSNSSNSNSSNSSNSSSRSNLCQKWRRAIHRPTNVALLSMEMPVCRISTKPRWTRAL
jgi:hypothetical protein